MDKILELFLKNVPAAVMPGFVASAALFLGVYYFKGYRNYTDALHDRVFLSGLVVITGLFILAHIHKDRVPSVPPDSATPVLIVPDFDDDERGQFKALFVQYLDSALSAADKGVRRVMTLDTFITDIDGARLTGQKYRASAVVFAPRVIRMKEKTVVCFTVFMVAGGLVKPYPPVSIEIDKATLDDLAQTLVFNQNANASTPNPLITRLDSLEKQLAELRHTVAKLGESRVALTPPPHGIKRALLIGIDKYFNPKIPQLRFAVSDARRMAAALSDRGFSTTVLADATKEDIERGVQDLVGKSQPDDLIVVYITGMSTKSSDLGFTGKLTLVLPATDLNTGDMEGNWDLARLVAMLENAKARHKLIILDGCHGTAGLQVEATPAGSHTLQNESFQILASSQDDQYSYESTDSGGGVFTAVLVDELRTKPHPDEYSMRQSFGELSAAVEAKSRGKGARQIPKLVNVRGSGDIFL